MILLRDLVGLGSPDESFVSDAARDQIAVEASPVRHDAVRLVCVARAGIDWWSRS